MTCRRRKHADQGNLKLALELGWIAATELGIKRIDRELIGIAQTHVDRLVLAVFRECALQKVDEARRTRSYVDDRDQRDALQARREDRT
ncbi:hypothetical protein D9M68_758650 [compost metagenome]